MAVRKFKPTTPGQRHKIIGTFEEITASVPEKSLVYGKRSSGGRNHTGKMTVRYIGGGHKRKFRLVDFRREKDGVPAVVKTIEYDPNRSARIALLYYADGEKRYIIAPLAYMRGRTLDNAMIILDEAQNTTSNQMKMFITRLGFNSKMVITGDVTQIDLPNHIASGLTVATRILTNVPGIAHVQFGKYDVMRHPLVSKIIEKYEENDD